MKITYEGAVYDLDLDDLDIDQAIKIEQHVRGSLSEWEQGMAKASAPCLQALAWLIFTGGDLAAQISDTHFKVMKLGRALAAAQEAEAEAGPTAAASPPDGGSTSARSARSSGSPRPRSAG